MIADADSRQPRTTTLRLNAAILVVYVAVVLPASLLHGMWRDELQAWLIARDSPDLSTLFRNLHYEGHALLWPVLLVPLTRLGRDPVSMQLLHAAIAVANVALVLWRAPLNRLERLLFPFGFFFVYQYAVYARSYGLGCFLVFLFCALWPRRRQSPVIMAIVLAAMSNVEVLFMIISIGAVLALAFDRLTGDHSPGEAPTARPRSYLAAAIILLAGWSLAVATSSPPPDASYGVGWEFGWSLPRLQKALSALGVFFKLRPSIWASLATGAIVMIGISRFRHNPPAAVFMAVSIAGLLSFFYAIYAPGIWHMGLIFIVVFATIWIDRLAPIPATPSPRLPLVPTFVFSAVLMVQIYIGVTALWVDHNYPQSRGREVARFIAAQGWAADPIVGVPDYATVTVIGYLGAKRAYYPNGARWGSFVVWDLERLKPVDLAAAMKEIDQWTSAVTWIGDISTGDPALMKQHGFLEVARFTGAIFENFIVYRRAGTTKP